MLKCVLANKEDDCISAFEDATDAINQGLALDPSHIGLLELQDMIQEN
jgi:hypothetical protein